MNKKLVRASYESCMDATARLSAYATSTPFPSAPEVNERQDVLAKNDLIVFCIHARRLIENVGLRDLLNNTDMKASDGKPFSLWRIIGFLIHNDELEILRCRSRFRMLQLRLESRADDEFWARVEVEYNKPNYSEPMPPYILFKSDKVHYTLVNLREFLRVFSQEIIIEVVKRAQDKELFLLDDPFKDMDLSEGCLKALKSVRSN